MRGIAVVWGGGKGVPGSVVAGWGTLPDGRLDDGSVVREEGKVSGDDTCGVGKG